jgi:hypothetical protein
MSAAPELKPVVEIIAAHLREITRGGDELGEPVLIELVFLSADDQAVVKDVRRYEPTVEGIQAAAEHAAAMNFHRLNAYVTVNPVSATNPPKTGKRASSEHIVAALLHWADGDDAGAVARIQQFVGPKPTFWVNTGRVPHQRPHIYWRLKEQTRDLPAWTGRQKAIAVALGTDPQVVDPPRIMRLAGTINWPKPQKQAKGYVPELVELHVPGDREPVASEDMARAFATAAPGASRPAIDLGPQALDRALAAANIKQGENWHRNVVRIVGSYVSKGLSDEEIHLITDAFTLPGWEVKQTRKEVQKAIDGAKRKGYAPEPNVGAAPDGDANTVEPVDLWGKFPPPLLPRGLLPKVIEDFAFTHGEQMGADPSGLAAAALCVCCAAIPDRIMLRVKRHDEWYESPRIWVAVIGDPSTKKSPTLGVAEKPLRKLDHALFRDFARRKEEYDALSKQEKAAAERPKQVRLRLEDTTIEAAQEVMADSPNGVLVMQDELSGWFGGMDRYAGSKGRDRAFWLQAYNGAPYTFNRIGRGAGYVPNLSACVLGGIQPEPIRKVVADATDDGLIQRLLPIVLRGATIGHDDAPPTEAVRAYGMLIEQLTRVELPPVRSSIDTGDRPRAHLVFEDGAQEIRRELEQRHLDLMLTEVFNRKLAAHIGKYDGIFARLCVAFHVIECSAGGLLPQVITADVARRVADFMHAFLLPHAYAFYGGVLGLSDDHDRLTAIAGYILAHGTETISSRDVQRGDGTMRKLDWPETVRVMNQLEALGWVSEKPAVRANGKPTWIVTPEVHRLFADRGAAEAERRQKARQLIQEAAKCRG